jgi:hypothetical protein
MQFVLLPVQRGTAIFASRSTFFADALLSTARRSVFAGATVLPIPGVTLQFAGVSSTVQFPPWSAVPQPLVTVRLKLSDAIVVAAIATEPVPAKSSPAKNTTAMATVPTARIRLRSIGIIPHSDQNPFRGSRATSASRPQSALLRAQRTPNSRYLSRSLRKALGGRASLEQRQQVSSAAAAPIRNCPLFAPCLPPV